MIANRGKLIFLLLILLLVFLKQGTARAVDFASTPKISQDEVIVRFKSGIDENARDRLHRDLGTRTALRIPRLNAEVVKIPSGRVEEFVNILKRHSHIQYAEPNFVANTLTTTNDPSLSSQWGLFKIDAVDSLGESAFNVSTGASSVKIAVLDTGVDLDHPDLVGKIVSTANFTTDLSTEDGNGHGTHTAGIAAAQTNNSVGVAGTGYNSSLMIGKVLDNSGSGFYSWVANGIIWAADNGAKVISLSLGGTSSSHLLEDAVNYAWGKGVVIVAAAGNSNKSTPLYPAYYANSMAVAATNSGDTKASFSSHGTWVDIAAPGESIYSTYKNGSYASASGTSMATPFVSGVAALVWAKGDCSTNSCVRDKIQSSADKITGTGIYWSNGRVNAYNALVNPIATPTPSPAPTATPTPIPSELQTMTATEIYMWHTSYSIRSRVTVKNEATLAPLSSAKVYLTMKDPNGVTRNFSGNTNSSGKVTFSWAKRMRGLYEATITNITKTDYIYHPTVTTASHTLQ